ncbi:MAG: hypothetical protein JWR63_3198, partial [Conexibacter sp.]|nr:hypothetical protein [Conexibacter sp.]
MGMGPRNHGHDHGGAGDADWAQRAASALADA